MAHAYTNFPLNGPLDRDNLPLGKCACGRWEHSTAAPQPCPNVPQCKKYPFDSSYFIVCCEAFVGLISSYVSSWFEPIYHRWYPRSAHFTVPVGQLPPLPAEPLSCPHPICLTDIVQHAFDTIDRSVRTASSQENRKAILLIARCPRGGKTTILKSLCGQFRKTNINSLYVTFNGTSGFMRLSGESDCEALFRVIASAFDVNISMKYKIKPDWELLDCHIGSHPFVLVMDEINVLCPKGVGSELTFVLKTYFLNKINRQVVVSSHLPFIEERFDRLVDDSKGFFRSSVYSDFGIVFLELPQTFEMNLLKDMDPSGKCRQLTPHMASYYGGVPSIMYTVCTQAAELPQNKFYKLFGQSRNSNMEEFANLCEALVTGIACSDVEKFDCLTSRIVSTFTTVKLVWPMCYFACIIGHFSCPVAEQISKFITNITVQMQGTGDGSVWESCVQIAIMFNFVLAAYKSRSGPFHLCTAKEAKDAEIVCIPIDEAHTSVDLPAFRNHLNTWAKNYSNNTLVLFAPKHRSFKQFDGFIARIYKKKIVKLCGYQCKAGSAGADDVVPNWINGGGFLLRGNGFDTVHDHSHRNWTYYTKADVDDFLGLSLASMKVVDA